MERRIEELQIVGFDCRLYLPPNYDESMERYPIVYVNGEILLEGILTILVKNGGWTDFILLSIKPKSWNDDFTPWAAPAIRAGEEAPQGRADTYLSRLTKEIKPYMDAHYRTNPCGAYGAVRIFAGRADGGLCHVQNKCIWRSRQPFRVAVV